MCTPIWMWNPDGTNGGFSTAHCSGGGGSGPAVWVDTGWFSTPDVGSWVLPGGMVSGGIMDSLQCPSCGCGGSGGNGGSGGPGGGGFGGGSGSGNATAAAGGRGFGVYGPGFSVSLSLWLIIALIVYLAITDRG